MVLQKKREGDNEEVSGVPEQVDSSILDNVVIICGSIDQCMYVCLVSSNYYWIHWVPGLVIQPPTTTSKLMTVSISLCVLTFQDVVLHLWPSCQMRSSLQEFWDEVHLDESGGDFSTGDHRVHLGGEQSARSRWRGALPSTRAPSTTTSRCSSSLAMSHSSGAPRQKLIS